MLEFWHGEFEPNDDGTVRYIRRPSGPIAFRLVRGFNAPGLGPLAEMFSSEDAASLNNAGEAVPWSFQIRNQYERPARWNLAERRRRGRLGLFLYWLRHLRGIRE